MASPGEEQLEAFRRDGFIIIEEGFIGPAAVEALRARFEPLFAGTYPTGIRPDEVNWVAGRDPEDRTRQLCNAWKADPVIAAQVLSERAGSLAAQLMGWSGARIVQDNVLWKPPGAKSLGMHQDASYAGYLVPPEMVTVWMALDDTVAEGGTVEYVRARARRVPRARGLARTGRGRRSRRGAGRAGAGRRAGGRRVDPPRADLPRLGPQRGRLAPARARRAFRAGARAL
jgi:hypothetical protein